MRVVFMGTPRYAATILEELASHHDVIAVYTKKDAIRGRGSTLVPSPVKEVALEAGIPVFQPKTLRDAQVQEQLRELNPEVICVAAYSMILPKEVLDIPAQGCLNVHASLLPRWRGAAPIERALLAGDERVGVCIMNMEEGLDTGDWCVRRELPVGDMNADEITDELANIGAQSLLTALAHMEHGCLHWTSQDERLATYANKIEKRELHLHPEECKQLVLAKIRCANEAHPCKITIKGKGVSVLKADDPRVQSAQEIRASIFQSEDNAPAQQKPLSPDVDPGTVRIVQKRLYLGCSDGCIELLEVKPDGKQAMTATAYAQGVQGMKQGVAWEAVRD